MIQPTHLVHQVVVLLDVLLLVAVQNAVQVGEVAVQVDTVVVVATDKVVVAALKPAGAAMNRIATSTKVFPIHDKYLSVFLQPHRTCHGFL